MAFFTLAINNLLTAGVVDTGDKLIAVVVDAGDKSVEPLSVCLRLDRFGKIILKLYTATQKHLNKI